MKSNAAPELHGAMSWDAIQSLADSVCGLIRRDEGAEATYRALQAIVRSVRNARAEYGVELGKKVPATVMVEDEALRNALAEELPLLGLLAKLEVDQSSVTGAGSGEVEVRTVTGGHMIGGG